MPQTPSGPESPIGFRLLPTPDANTFTFATTHEQDVVKEWPKQYQTTFGKWKHCIVGQKGKMSASGIPYGDFIYTDTSEAPAGYVTFLWAPQMTQEQKDTPFKTTTRFGDHHWPGVLKKVEILEDNSFPNATNGYDGGAILAPRYFDRVVYIPPVNEGSQFVETEYISPTPFEIGQYPVPTPTAVSYSYLGISGNFPSCLHDRLVFPAKRMATRAWSQGDGTTGAAGALGGQIFPATNFRDWGPYTVSFTSQSVNGINYAKKVVVYPPPPPKTVTQ